MSPWHTRCFGSGQHTKQSACAASVARLLCVIPCWQGSGVRVCCTVINVLVLGTTFWYSHLDLLLGSAIWLCRLVVPPGSATCVCLDNYCLGVE